MIIAPVPVFMSASVRWQHTKGSNNVLSFSNLNMPVSLIAIICDVEHMRATA